MRTWFGIPSQCSGTRALPCRTLLSLTLSLALVGSSDAEPNCLGAAAKSRALNAAYGGDWTASSGGGFERNEQVGDAAQRLALLGTPQVGYFTSVARGVPQLALFVRWEEEAPDASLRCDVVVLEPSVEGGRVVWSRVHSLAEQEPWACGDAVTHRRQPETSTHSFTSRICALSALTGVESIHSATLSLEGGQLSVSQIEPTDDECDLTAGSPILLLSRSGRVRDVVARPRLLADELLAADEELTRRVEEAARRAAGEAGLSAVFDTEVSGQAWSRAFFAMPEVASAVRRQLISDGVRFQEAADVHVFRYSRDGYLAEVGGSVVRFNVDEGGLAAFGLRLGLVASKTTE